MTAPTNDPSGDALQFDAAEPAASAAPGGKISCANCQRTITTSYHTLNAAVICSTCRGRLERELTGGTGLGRFSGAFMWGLGGAVIGALIYYAVLALTGYEVGLIAIAVGWLVGRGVQKGSNGRGGPAYQAIAVVLTYFAIVSTYIPLIINSAREQARIEAASDSIEAEEAALVPDAAAPSSGSGTLVASAASADSSAVAAKADPTFGEVVMAFAFMLAFAAVVPFLAGIKNIIGLLIIGFALYQAWKMNKRVPLAFSGPFKVEGPAPA